MSLSLDGSSDVSAQSCDACGTTSLLVKSFVHDAGAAQAIVMTACHRHDGEREAWIDAVMGGFGKESTDRVTFGCRVGPVANKPEPAATAVAAAVPYDDAPLWGRKLSREEALAHPRIADFWRVVELVLEREPVVKAHVYGRRP